MLLCIEILIVTGVTDFSVISQMIKSLCLQFLSLWSRLCVCPIFLSLYPSVPWQDYSKCCGWNIWLRSGAETSSGTVGLVGVWTPQKIR